eukprot:1874494-Prymnesium_polylepis.1
MASSAITDGGITYEPPTPMRPVHRHGCSSKGSAPQRPGRATCRRSAASTTFGAPATSGVAVAASHSGDDATASIEEAFRPSPYPRVE